MSARRVSLNLAFKRCRESQGCRCSPTTPSVRQRLAPSFKVVLEPVCRRSHLSRFIVCCASSCANAGQRPELQTAIASGLSRQQRAFVGRYRGALAGNAVFQHVNLPRFASNHQRSNHAILVMGIEVILIALSVFARSPGH